MYYFRLLEVSFFLGLFMYFEREKAGKGQRRERIPGRLRTVSTEPDTGLELMNCQDHDLSRNQELDA